MTDDAWLAFAILGVLAIVAAVSAVLEWLFPRPHPSEIIHDYYEWKRRNLRRRRTSA